tara:strand:+ start:2429 stop:3340 length:912 start_codon:yes stop_codon:yes gene_type:complete
MIFILGASGYVGQQFAYELDTRGIEYMEISREEYNYYNYDVFSRMLENIRPQFVINCAGYTGKPNVDACELFQEETFTGNVTLPAILAKACDMNGVPWGHVSSGCIYNGYDKAFTEEDDPNFCFDKPPCSHYSGTKALGEQRIQEIGGKYFIWRLRIPFDQYDSPRNYLTKVQKYDKLLDMENSISHRADFAKYCIDLWLNDCDYGIYNVVNTNPVTTKRVTEEIKKHLNPNLKFKFFRDEDDFMEIAAQTPRSNCVLDNTKLKKALGKHKIRVRTALQAIKHSLTNWEEENEDRNINESFWK